MSKLSINQLAQMSKAAGDPLRLSILRLLGDGAFGVMELCRVFDIKQSSMSHHLKVLAKAGLVSTQREGNSIFYRRPLLSQHGALQEWLLSFFQTLDKTEHDQVIGHTRDLVLAERANICAEFFARNAEAFTEQQDLIAAFDQYQGSLVEILASVRRPDAARALEIGPGNGEFVPTLAQHFDQVTALDNSPEMLKRTQQTVKEHQCDNVECFLGDTQALLQEQSSKDTSGSFDFAVANMVLHHVPAPKAIFADVGQLLKVGGQLLITDLCRHDQDWAKDSCGDLWLGFEPEDLTSWATEAGMQEVQSQYLGLRNGFHIQFRLFHRCETAII